MRSFSEFEKKIINRMIELDEKSGSLNVLGNIFDSFLSELKLPNYCYVEIISEENVTIQLKKDALDQLSPPDLRVIDDQLSKILLTTVKLFEYLEINGLAYFVGDLDLKTLGEVWEDTDYVTCEFLENESKKLLYYYTRKKIYVTEELKEIYRNKFKTEEQISTQKELLYTRIALLLAFSGLLSSILIPIIFTSNVEIIKELDVKNIGLISSEIKKQSNVLSQSSSSINETLYSIKDDIYNLVKNNHYCNQTCFEEIECKNQNLDKIKGTLNETTTIR